MDHWKSKRVPEKIYFCFIDYTKAFDRVDHNKLWKILKEMGILGHLTCLLRICMQIKKQQLELDVDPGKDWRQEEKGVTEDEMVGWHHWLDGMSLSKLWELVMDRKALACCCPWGRKESHTFELLNWTEHIYLPSLLIYEWNISFYLFRDFIMSFNNISENYLCGSFAHIL